MAVKKCIYRSLILISFILNSSFVQGQLLKESANWILHHSIIDTTSPGESSFRIYPTIAYSPETDLEIGLSTIYLYQARNDTGNRISELNAFTFFTLRGQYGIWLDNALYGHEDKWFILGRMRFQRFPLLYYGVGPDATASHPSIIDANYFILRQRVLRKISNNLFLGPEIDYQNLSNTHVEYHKDDLEREIPIGSSGSSNLALGGAIVYDNRHNVLNARKGIFAELGILAYSDKLGSSYHFTGINTDIRSFTPMNKRDVLALQLTGNFYSGNVPFNQMALMGGETMMRGYYLGRYRDKNMIAAQAEYRLLPLSFSKRIGAGVFASSAIVAPAIRSFRFDNLKIAGGAGIRYLLFPKKDIFVRLDVGITREGLGFYFFTGEAF